MNRILRSVALITVASYVGLVLLITFRQRRFYYVPTVQTVREAEAAGAAAGFDRWTNRSGAFLGWRRPAIVRKPVWTVLILHGNAQTAADRGYLADPISEALGAEVFVVEYPGYGDRPGSPTQTSLLAAADEAFSMLPTDRPIALVAESLGTGPAAWLAHAHPDHIAGIAFLAPFNHLSAVAANRMPWLPARLCLWDQFPADLWIENFHGPAAFGVAGADTIIPPRLGRSLCDGYGGPKRLWEFPGLDHNEALRQAPDWWREVGAFWRSAAVETHSIP